MVELNPTAAQNAEDEVWGVLQGRSMKVLGWTDPIPGMAKGSPGQDKPIGSFWEGHTKEAPSRRQASDYTTKQPKTYTDGNPIMEVVLVLDTPYRDQGDTDDDGTRRLILNNQGQRALQDEMRRLGIQRFGVGTYIKMTLAGFKPNPQGRPSKLFTIELRPTPWQSAGERAAFQQVADAGRPQVGPDGRVVQTYAQPPAQPAGAMPPTQQYQQLPVQYSGQPTNTGYPNSMVQGYQQPMSPAEQHIAGQPPRVDAAFIPAPQQQVQQAPQVQQQAPSAPAPQAPAAPQYDDGALAAAVSQLEAANFDRATAVAAVSAMPQFRGVTVEQIERAVNALV